MGSPTTRASSSQTTTVYEELSALRIDTYSASRSDEEYSTTEIQITDFCRRLLVGCDRQTKCLGFISDESTRYKIYPKTLSSDDAALYSRFSLAEALSRSKGDLPRMTRADRLRLASMIATAVLHLHNSPLLASSWTRNDIIFIRRGTNKSYQQAYIAKHLPESNPQSIEASSKLVPFIPNPTLFALGILLIELCLDQPFDNLRSPEDLSVGDQSPDELADYRTAMRLLNSDRLLEEGGLLYDSAVRRCIRCIFDVRSTDLEEKEFLEAVYNGVVASLEDAEIAFSMGTKNPHCGFI